MNIFILTLLLGIALLLLTENPLAWVLIIIGVLPLFVILIIFLCIVCFLVR